MIVTVNELALVIGVAAFGTLYLNLAGRCPQAARTPRSGCCPRAVTVTCIALVAAAVGGAVLAAIRAATTRQAAQ